MAKKAKAILCLVDGTIVTKNKVMETGRASIGDTITHAAQDYEVLRVKRPDLSDPSLPAADQQDPHCRYVVKAI